MKTFITLRDDLTVTELADFIRISSIQSQAISKAIGSNIEEQCDLSDPVERNFLTNLQWALSGLLEMNSQACEQLDVLLLPKEGA